MAGERDRSQRPGFVVGGEAGTYREADREFKVSREDVKELLENAIEQLDYEDRSPAAVVDVLIEELEKLRT